MRQIEFRGIDVKSREWKFGSLVINRYTSINGDDPAFLIYEFDPYEGIIYEVDKESVGQYIGKHDVHNNKIYEGDFVKDAMGSMWEVSFFDKGMYWIPFTFPCNSAPESFEVIGNKYDNPDLAKEV